MAKRKTNTTTRAPGDGPPTPPPAIGAGLPTPPKPPTEGLPPTPPLAPDQNRRDIIVTHLDQTMLVEASAGAGKTRSMVDRMIALLAEGKCRVETLAAITFTRKAAAELRARFQVALETSARGSVGEAHDRLSQAVERVERVIIGTIHSFCARLLRERPVEAGVEPSFQELEEATDVRLRTEAWQQYVAELIVTGDGILDELNQLGVQIADLQGAFQSYATYPDVDEWPAPPVKLPDLSPARDGLRTYVGHMARLLPSLPEDHGNDKLMPQFQRIVRIFRQLDLDHAAELMELLAEFGELGKRSVVHKEWPGEKSQAVAELTRWNDFVSSTAAPLVSLWRQARYPVILRALEGAVGVYNRRRQEAGGLNYQDLLLLAAGLLRDKPQVRQYFRRRFTHLLVDEFQDTDPVQAEVMLLLTADDTQETDWRRARPVPGSLFVVGDPKQSIYRFRRADIVTYNEVKRIIEQRGEIVTLTANFRSLKPVIDWVNDTFDQVFPATADAHSPARSPMAFVHGVHKGGPTGKVEVLRIPASHGTNDAVMAYDVDAVARTIEAALSPAAGGGSAKPGDFLILSTRKRNLSRYAAKLHELGIPCEVTGGTVMNHIPELALLCVCLEALVEPDNPVSLVALLRSELFGLSDESLYAFKRAGGRFAFQAGLPDNLPKVVVEPFKDAFERLKRYDSWLKRLPPVAAIERIVADLGLYARAAAALGGNVNAGSIALAMELIRAAQPSLPSLTEIVGFLRQLVAAEEKHDGLPAATPAQAPVRIMNLHQAKGLEAPFVFLADPTGKKAYEPELHVDRSGNRVRGFLRVSVARGEYSSELLACPENWETYADEEKKFQDAERNRLLYVAATRAGARLTVSQREKRNDLNPWSPLHEHLAGCPDMPVPEPVASVSRAERSLAADAPAAATMQIASRWTSVRKPSYAVAAAKAISVSPSRLAPSSGEHGTEWGTVIHSLLENAMRDPKTDLKNLVHASLTEQGLDPALADQAVATVQAAMKSDIWKRAQASPQRLVEVPFQTFTPPDPAIAESVPTIIRGVIDLVFREDKGWVLVDYKTDARSESELPALVDHYRGQLETYARVWEQTVCEPVAETGLHFTHTGVYVGL